MVSIGGAATEDSADPELIVSSSVQYGNLRDPSSVLYGQASSTQRTQQLIQGEVFSFTYLNNAECRFN
jgi:hypothetical protein